MKIWECLHVNRLIYTYLSITGLDQWFFIHVVRILASFCVSFLLLLGPNVTITQPSNSLLGALAIRPGNFCPYWSSAKNVAFVVTGPVQALSPVTTILYLCFCQLEYKQKNSKINTKNKKITPKIFGAKYEHTRRLHISATIVLFFYN